MSSVLTSTGDPDEIYEAFGATVDPGKSRLFLSGELDVAGVPDLLHRALELAGRRHVDLALDLDRLSFVDASGLGAFVRLSNVQNSVGARLNFERAGSQVRRAFTLGGLAGLLAAAA